MVGGQDGRVWQSFVGGVSHEVDAGDRGLEVSEVKLFFPPEGTIEDVGFERHDWLWTGVGGVVMSPGVFITKRAPY